MALMVYNALNLLFFLDLVKIWRFCLRVYVNYLFFDVFFFCSRESKHQFRRDYQPSLRLGMSIDWRVLVELTASVVKKCGTKKHGRPILFLLSKKRRN